MYKKLTAGLLLLSMIALPGLSYNAAQAKTPQKTAIKPKVIKTVNTDVTGDKIADNIKLIGLKKYEPACIFCGGMNGIVSYRGYNVCRDCQEKLAAMLSKEDTSRED